MPPPADAPATLEDLRDLTASIAAGQQEVDQLSRRRKQVIRSLAAAGTDYRDMAAAMGVTVATVYRLVPKQRRPALP